jgi:hypothetical protein
VSSSNELNLAIECCRWNFARGSTTAICELADGVDWARFASVVQFHRIQGLCWHALQQAADHVPQAVVNSLAQDAQAIAAANLRAAIASRDLLTAFEADSVPLLFLKGLTLGALAYGKPTLKSAIDIDLLIDGQNLGKAADLLRKAGYKLIAPAESPGDAILSAWHVGWKESVWAKASPVLQIDLHTRTADNPRLIPLISVHSARQWVKVSDNIELPTLADEELFAYLAVHGASSAWFRLKWISDFAGLVHGRSADEIGRLYRRSLQLGAGRAAGQALLVADGLFDILQPCPHLRDELRRDRATRRLCRVALHLLTRDPREPTEQRWGTFAIHSSQFLLLPAIGYKLSELKRQAARLYKAG